MPYVGMYLSVEYASGVHGLFSAQMKASDVVIDTRLKLWWNLPFTPKQGAVRLKSGSILSHMLRCYSYPAANLQEVGTLVSCTSSSAVIKAFETNLAISKWLSRSSKRTLRAGEY
jgi:hypothetical protein